MHENLRFGKEDVKSICNVLYFYKKAHRGFIKWPTRHVVQESISNKLIM